MTNLRIVYLLVLLFWLLLTVAHNLAGQTHVGDLVVDIPFSFVAGGETLPAGHYVLAAFDETRIRIFSRQTTGVFVPTHASRRNHSDDSKLVFHRYGQTYFLSALWVRGNPTGRELFPTPAERELSSRQPGMQLAVVRPLK